MATHGPDWHILDNAFAEANTGIALPMRKLQSGNLGLKIENLDRDDPPDFSPGGMPRGLSFNRNVFQLTAEPCMPVIPVKCSIQGFDPAATTIQWRLVCRHVLSRHSNAGNFQYRGACEVFQQEWRGESRSASFSLFGPATPECICTYNDNSRVLGGHAVLMVGVVSGGTALLDYVHLRICGANPSQTDVFRYLDSQLAEYDRNIVNMARAIFEHESAFRQFASGPQSAAAMTFRRQHHKDPDQPDCRVRFDWPDDPVNFPLASFDFGVGISQFTRVAGQKVSAEIAWDWRENIRIGCNLFLGKLQRKFQSGLTWRHWAMDGWAAYNGSGAAALAYAKALSMSPEGSRVSLDPVAEAPKMAQLQPPPAVGDPGSWLLDRQLASTAGTAV